MNHADGGATALDLLPQLEQIASHPDDVLVISIGTNDLAQWKQVPLPRFRQAVLHVLQLTSRHRTIFLLPPPLAPARQHATRPTRTRTPHEQRGYLTELIALTRDSAAGIITLPADHIHDTDGVHLNDHGYDLLIAAIREHLSAPENRRPPPHSSPPARQQALGPQAVRGRVLETVRWPARQQGPPTADATAPRRNPGVSLQMHTQYVHTE